MLAVRLAVPPTTLASRVRRAQCALCAADLTYVRRYFEKRHSCAQCETELAAGDLAALRDLERYL